MKKIFYLLSLILLSFSLPARQKHQAEDIKLQYYVNLFNNQDQEAVKNFVPNAQAFVWLKKNIPLLECPDKAIEQNYYFRWWTFRKHLVKTPVGFIFTEFIEPVKHAGKYNSVSCALGHHLYEGRWLKDNIYLDDYIKFWLYEADKGESKPRFHQFSSWVDDAILQRHLVKPNKSFLLEVLPALDKDYEKWERERQLSSGLFWQHDVKDGMEESVSGSRKDENRRPTINSYMYANAKALAEMALIDNNSSLHNKYSQKANKLRKLVLDSLWDVNQAFFKTKMAKGALAKAREAIGFVPWDFNLPIDAPQFARAWDQLIDTGGFNAPWGLTTAERREPSFRTRGSGHGCEWDGAIWPFATSQTLKGLSNLLTNYKNKGKMNAGIFYNELQKYALSHIKNGKPYIGEYQDEKNGEWLKGDNPRSSFYNHSTFADLVISDLIGVKPRADNLFELYPLIPEGRWDWFKLSNISYHGKTIDLLWDKTGKKYGQGKGLFILVNGKIIHKAQNLKPIKVKI